jgi:hypothetical protein
VRRIALNLLLCGTLLTACKQSASEDARTLVDRYNRAVSEAYRSGDVTQIGSVVGPREGKKLSALIGVRRDFGLALDSHLVSLEVTGVERSKNTMRVRTNERWRYRDIRMGTGELASEESLDTCKILYIFTNINRAWLVEEIYVTKSPRVGPSQTPGTADSKAAPSIPSPATPSGRGPQH